MHFLKIRFFDRDLRFVWSKNMQFGLKWVHMAQYELILRLDGAIWLRIIFKPLLTLERAMEGPKILKESKMAPRREAIHAPEQMRHGHMMAFGDFLDNGSGGMCLKHQKRQRTIPFKFKEVSLATIRLGEPMGMPKTSSHF